MEVVEGSWQTVDFSKGDFSGALVQYPDADGTVHDFSSFVDSAHKHGVFIFKYFSDLLL